MEPYSRPGRDAGDATFRGTFHNVSQTFRRNHAGIFTRFADISQRFADVSRVSRGYAGVATLRGVTRSYAELRGVTRGFTQGITHVSQTFRKRFADVSRRDSVSRPGRL